MSKDYLRIHSSIYVSTIMYSFEFACSFISNKIIEIVFFDCIHDSRHVFCSVIANHNRINKIDMIRRRKNESKI